MRHRQCCLCSGSVDGVSDNGIRLEFCCRRCYIAHPSEVTRREALKRLHVTEADLAVLNCRTHAPDNIDSRIYVSVEVEYLGRLRDGKRRWEDRHKRKATQEALMKKRMRLEKAADVKLHHVPHALRPFVFGDYLARQRGARIARKTIQTRLRAHKRAFCVMDRCGTDPMTALDFCSEYPNWGPEEFQNLRERIQTVFRLEGRRILHKVPKTQRCKLLKTPLEDIYQEFNSRDTIQLVLHYLKRKTSADIATEILTHPASRGVLSRGGDEETIARVLWEFWNERNDKKGRQQRLEAALKLRKLTMPQTARVYQDYINGQVCLDLNEILACAELGHRLKQRGAQPWGCFFHWNCQTISTYIHHEHLSPEEAIEKVLKLRK